MTVMILRGDKRRAMQWMPWAEGQLIRHKAFGMPIINQVFKPVNCVTVHVRSINGVDRIRIHVCPEAKEKCKVDFSVDITGDVVSFTSKQSDNINQLFWDFGDGDFERASLNPTHQYRQGPGDYQATLYGFETDGVNIPDREIMVEAERRQAAQESSNVISHGIYSLPETTWNPLASIFASSGHTVTYIPTPSETWQYSSSRITLTFPLDQLLAFDSVVEKRAFIYTYGLFMDRGRTSDSIAYPIVRNLQGSDLGLEFRDDTIFPSIINGIIDINTPMVESKMMIVDAADVGLSEPYPILPDPKPDHSEGWSAGQPMAAGFKSLRAFGYKCKTLRTKTITIV